MHSKSFSRRFFGLFGTLVLLPLTVGAGGKTVLAQGESTVPGPAVARPASEATIELATYRVALSQILAGHADSARLLLEADKGPLPPESASLLAFLSEKSGDMRSARAAMERVSTPTPLAAAYRERLGMSNATRRVPEAGQDQVVTPGAARLIATDARLTRLEQHMVKVINQERAAAGLSELDWNEPMAEVARAHSAEMRDAVYFSHESPTPALRQPIDRYILGIGGSPRVVAENIYRAWGNHSLLSDADIDAAHKSLMDSPGHRANLLLKNVTRIGIGIATDATGNIWVTQLFAKP